MVFLTRAVTRMENLPNISPNRITVIIPNWNGMRWLNGCLTALSEQSFDCFNTLVVDNGSTDNSVQFIQDNFPEIQIECLQLNAGFAHAVNLGIKQSTTPYVVLLNTDTIVYPDWLGNLYQRIESAPDDIGAIASKLIQMDNPSLIDNAGDDLSWYGVATKIGNGKPIENYDQEREIFSPTAGATLYRREFLNKTGGVIQLFSLIWKTSISVSEVD